MTEKGKKLRELFKNQEDFFEDIKKRDIEEMPDKTIIYEDDSYYEHCSWDDDDEDKGLTEEEVFKEELQEAYKDLPHGLNEDRTKVLFLGKEYDIIDSKLLNNYFGYSEYKGIKIYWDGDFDTRCFLFIDDYLTETYMNHLIGIREHKASIDLIFSEKPLYYKIPKQLDVPRYNAVFTDTWILNEVYTDDKSCFDDLIDFLSETKTNYYFDIKKDSYFWCKIKNICKKYKAQYFDNKWKIKKEHWDNFIEDVNKELEEDNRFFKYKNN